jgi:hypothetical protein
MKGRNLGIDERLNTFTKEIIGACIEREPEPPVHQLSCVSILREEGNHLRDMVFEYMEIGDSLLMELRSQ